MTIRLSAAYFFLFGGLGTLLPFFSLWLQSQGLGAWEIAVLSVIAPFVKLWLPPALGLLADLRTGRRPILLACTWLTVLVWPLFFVPSTFAGWVAVFAFMALVRGPVIPIVNAIALQAIHDHQTPLSFGRIRLWGSVGFVLATISAGWMADTWGLATVIHLMGAMFVSLALVASNLPASAAPPRHNGGTEKLRSLLRPGPFLTMLLGLFLVRGAEGGYNLFFSVHIVDLGYTEGIAGYLWALAVISEVLVLWFFGPRMRGRSVIAFIAAAAALNSLRWVILALATSLPWLLIAQLLHGFTFGLFYIAAIEVLERLAPPDFKTTVQGIFDTVGFGLSGIAGQLVMGWIWEQSGSTAMFTAMAVVAACGVLVLAPLARVNQLRQAI